MSGAILTPNHPLWARFLDTLRVIQAMNPQITATKGTVVKTPVGNMVVQQEGATIHPIAIGALSLMNGTPAPIDVRGTILSLIENGWCSTAEILHNWDKDPRKVTGIIFDCQYGHWRGIGDLLMLSAVIDQIPDHLTVEVRTSHPDVFANNPRLSKCDPATSLLRSWAESPRISPTPTVEDRWQPIFAQLMTSIPGVQIDNTTLRPRIYLTDEETAENPIGKPFWILNAGYKGGQAFKFWGRERYQRVVDILKDKITFVQVGSSTDVHPRIEGAVDMVGKTTLRQLFSLFYHSSGSLGPCSAHMHISAALDKPAVVIAGGTESREYSAYPGHVFHTVAGKLSCSPVNGCFPVAEIPSMCRIGVPPCMAMISPDDVAASVLSCEGGVK